MIKKSSTDRTGPVKNGFQSLLLTTVSWKRPARTARQRASTLVPIIRRRAGLHHFPYGLHFGC